MQSLKDSSIHEIKAVTGLFISDRFAARSVDLLKSLSITHVLSITGSQDTPQYDPSLGITHYHIDIDDDTLADLLIHLQSACDWIQVALESADSDNDAQIPGHTDSNVPAEGAANIRKAGVLIHCTQGISRSGALIIAYLMRTLSLPYASALSLARESRALITPNAGFEKQLRIWAFCNYSLVEPGTGSLTSASGNVVRDREKRPYTVWKRERHELVGRGDGAVNRERVRGMVGRAAELGRRRAEKEKEGKEGRGGRGKEWEKMEEMEREWNRKLIGGEVLGEFGGEKGPRLDRPV